MTPRSGSDSDSGAARHSEHRRRVAGNTTTGAPDTALTPHDRADNPTPGAGESRYAPVAAAQERHSPDADTRCATTQPTLRIDVEDGHVTAAVNPQLTAAAADALWRVIDRATTQGETA